ncbi:MAG: thioredoxin family protein [Candidatus Omnitrophica bacterium]|nr:thioredoxin family protein [Candidatus Omnitrophota bacterium]
MLSYRKLKGSYWYRDWLIKNLFIISFAFLSISFNWSDYKLFDLNKNQITFQELISKNDKTILFIWASSCYACRLNLSKFNKNPLDTPGIKLYYVNIGDNSNIVEFVVRKLKLNNIRDNIILDEYGGLGYKFNITILPTFIFLQGGKEIYRSNFISKNLINDIFHNG